MLLITLRISGRVKAIAIDKFRRCELQCVNNARGFSAQICACTPTLLLDIAEAPSYACPLMSLTSKFSFSSSCKMPDVIDLPVFLSGLKKSRKTSLISQLVVLSTKRRQRERISLFAWGSVTSSAMMLKILVFLNPAKRRSLMHQEIISFNSFCTVLDKYIWFCLPFFKWLSSSALSFAFSCKMAKKFLWLDDGSAFKLSIWPLRGSPWRPHNNMASTILVRIFFR